MVENLENEVWKPIKEYEGLYEVSNMGRVKSLAKNIPLPNGGERKQCDKIMSQSINQYGYYTIYLSKNGKRKFYRVNRLVALTFIPNPSNLPFVNHINEIKTDNRVENLEWCDEKYNVNFGTGIKRMIENSKGRKMSDESKKILSERMKGKFKGGKSPKAKKIIQMNLNNEIIKIWDSIREIDVDWKRYVSPSIVHVLKGQQQTAYGFKWKYA